MAGEPEDIALKDRVLQLLLLAWMQRYDERRLLESVPAVTAWLARLASLPPIAAALGA